MLDSIVIEPESTANAAVIWLHGLGADGSDFVPIVPELHLQPPPFVRFIFPHAPIRPITINNNIPMRGWYDIRSLTDLHNEDKSGITSAQQMINELITQQINQGIESQKIFLAGFSQGGAMALYTGLQYPQPLAGIIALSAYLPDAATLIEQNQSLNKTCRIFMAHGEYDEVLPLPLGQHSYNALRQLGCDISWHTYPIGHHVCQEEIHAVSQFLAV